jgi:hypothetical protein
VSAKTVLRPYSFPTEDRKIGSGSEPISSNPTHASDLCASKMLSTYKVFECGLAKFP